MIVGGLLWTTLLDYPDRVAATLFTGGCNLRCPFCHNAELVVPGLAEDTCRPLDEAFFRELEARRGFLDAVVISGGEPTLQVDLPEVLLRIKRLGYLTKLDTNGTRPDQLEQMLSDRLVDFVAMDIKAPPHKYERLSGVVVDTRSIERSIRLIRELAPQYEFRTTAAPGLSVDDLLDIGHRIADSHAYWLQRFRVPERKQLVDESLRAAHSLSRQDLESAWARLSNHFKRGGVRA